MRTREELQALGEPPASIEYLLRTAPAPADPQDPQDDDTIDPDAPMRPITRDEE